MRCTGVASGGGTFVNIGSPRERMNNAKRNQLTSGKPLNKRRMQSRPFVSLHNGDTHKNDQSAAGCVNLGSFNYVLTSDSQVPSGLGQSKNVPGSTRVRPSIAII